MTNRITEIERAETDKLNMTTFDEIVGKCYHYGGFSRICRHTDDFVFAVSDNTFSHKVAVTRH